MNNSTGSAPSNVRIVGASCAASALNQPPQTYGITVSDGSSDVFIEDCDLTGYTGTPRSRLISRRPVLMFKSWTALDITIRR